MIAVEQARKMLIYVSREIVKSEPLLTAIDIKIGDGDHGTGMKIGFSNVEKILKKNTYESMNMLFKDVGITLIKTMGGASGVLFGTFFIGGLSSVPDSTQLTTSYFADYIAASLESIHHRGKANVGDKTMIDALAPAVASLLKSKEENDELDIALNKATTEAKIGVESTKGMCAKFGRARKFGQLAIGFQDAGATSIAIIFDSMSNWISKHGG